MLVLVGSTKMGLSQCAIGSDFTELKAVSCLVGFQAPHVNGYLCSDRSRRTGVKLHENDYITFIIYICNHELFFTDPIFPPKFAVVNSKELGEVFDLRSPGRVVITRRFNITLVSTCWTKFDVNKRSFTCRLHGM